MPRHYNDKPTMGKASRSLLQGGRNPAKVAGVPEIGEISMKRRPAQEKTRGLFDWFTTSQKRK